MEFFETVNTRKTIRKYKQEHPPIEDIKKIIDSARLAPSATNSQNWRFIAIYNDKIKQEMADAVNYAYDELENFLENTDFSKQRAFSVFFKDAPVVIACIEAQRTSQLTELLKEKGLEYEKILLCRPDSSLLSMGAAIENMSLSATALGYGTCWMCAPIVAYKKFKTILNLKEDEKIVSILALGRPFNENTNRPAKKSLDEIMSVIE